MTRLLPNTRYIIAILGLKDTTGAAIIPAPFKALRDGTTLSQSLMPVKANYDDIFAKLTAAGVDRTNLTVAWDVTTASDETATSHLTGMVANAFALEAAGSLGYTITTPGTPTTTGDLYQEILATVKTPQYLLDNTGKSNLGFGADGQPVQNGTVDTPIVIHIPQCVTDPNTKFPIPTVVFGHGLFGSALETLQSPVFEAMSNTRCAIYIGTDWIGLSSSDITNVINIVSGDLNNVYVITDRLQQAHVNINTMTRVFANEIVKDPIMQVNGVPITDGKEIYYFGVSMGGIEGVTFMGINPDITRGVLNVPGAEWSLLMYRSTDFAMLKVLLSATFSDSLDAQVAIAATQPEWDYTDPATFAPHVIAAPLPGVPAKQSAPADVDRRRRGDQPVDGAAGAHHRRLRLRPRVPGLRRAGGGGAARFGVHAVGFASVDAAADDRHGAGEGQRRARGRLQRAARAAADQRLHHAHGPGDVGLHRRHLQHLAMSERERANVSGASPQ